MNRRLATYVWVSFVVLLITTVAGFIMTGIIIELLRHPWLMLGGIAAVCLLFWAAIYSDC